MIDLCHVYLVPPAIYTCQVTRWKEQQLNFVSNFGEEPLSLTQLLLCMACCHIANAFLSSLALIWPISLLKISKLPKNVSLAKSSKSRWVEAVLKQSSVLQFSCNESVQSAPCVDGMKAAWSSSKGNELEIQRLLVQITLLRKFARKFPNIDFFLRLLPLKVDDLLMSEM